MSTAEAVSAQLREIFVGVVRPGAYIRIAVSGGKDTCIDAPPYGSVKPVHVDEMGRALEHDAASRRRTRGDFQQAGTSLKGLSEFQCVGLRCGTRIGPDAFQRIH